tara:strand:+ start:2175 stop:3494 length:1320 start_codon:yes stop_codon:yes gene_type:complete
MRVFLAIFAALTFAAGCGDDDGDTTDPGDDLPGTDLGVTDDAGGEDPDGGPVPETIDRYIATVYDTDSEITYLAELDALTGTADFTGTQVVGSTIAVGFGDDPYVYIGSSASSTIGRYEFTVDGMVLDEEIDLLNEGTTATSGYQSHLILVDRTKAYYIDVPNNQLVIWNPTEMTITGSEDFSAPIAMADMRSGIGGFPVQVGTKLFYGVGWLDATTLEVVGGAAVLVIDTTDDTAELVRDPAQRCGYSFSVAEGTDGLYVATEAYGAASHALGDSEFEPCMVRFDPEAETFDASYEQDLTALVDGAPAGTIVPGPAAGQAYLRVLDESALPCTLAQWSMGDASCPAGGGGPRARLMSIQPAWKWFELTLGDEAAATEMPEAALTSGATLGIQTGTEVLVPEFADSTTDIRDFTGNTYGDIVVESPGTIRSVIHVSRTE